MEDMEGGDPTMTRLSPAVSLLSKRVLASPVSAPVSATAPQPSPSSAAVGVTANLPLMRTPEVTIAQPLSMSPPWLRHEMRYQAVMTPPPCVPSEQMITPDANQTFTHRLDSSGMGARQWFAANIRGWWCKRRI